MARNRINEDFFDGNPIGTAVEIDDIETSGPRFRFEHCVSCSKMKDSEGVLGPDGFNTVLKRGLHFIYNSGIFSNVRIDRCYMKLLYKDARVFGEITGVTLRDFRNGLVRDAGGTAMEFKSEDIWSEDYVTVEMHLVLSADVDLSNGRDLFNFLSAFTVVSRYGWTGYLKVFPLDPASVPEKLYGMKPWFFVSFPAVKRVYEFINGMYMKINASPAISQTAADAMKVLFMDGMSSTRFDKIFGRYNINIQNKN